MENHGDLISKATAEPPQVLVLFDMYDDWLGNISPFTAFYRLVLILRALDVDKEKAQMLLKQGRDGCYGAPPHLAFFVRGSVEEQCERISVNSIRDA